jgi:hypothetical protein
MQERKVRIDARLTSVQKSAPDFGCLNEWNRSEPQLASQCAKKPAMGFRPRRLLADYALTD